MTIRMWNRLTVLAMAAMVQPAAAQSMAKPMAMAKTYTGCLAAGSTAGTFTLTHAAEEMPMAKDGMKKDAMGMGKEMASMTFAIASSSVDLKGHVGHQVALTATEATSAMGMEKHDAMAKPGDAMAKPMDTMAKPGDAMAKPGAMAAPTASLAVSALRMIATKCKM